MQQPVADAVICTPETFWTKLCNPACVRTGYRKCVIGKTVYVTNKAPEEIPGFIDARIAMVSDALSDRRPRWLRWIWP